MGSEKNVKVEDDDREGESNSINEKVRPYYVLLRVVGMLLALLVTIMVGVDKETKSISIYPGMQFQATAHWHYMSAFVFFLASNAIACTYGAMAMVIWEVGRRRKEKKMRWRVRMVVTTLDMVMTCLLFSANGAAAAIGVIGQRGNSHVQWMRVCNVFHAYCLHMTTAIVLSLSASSVFLCLVILSLFTFIHPHHPPPI